MSFNSFTQLYFPVCTGHTHFCPLSFFFIGNDGISRALILNRNKIVEYLGSEKAVRIVEGDRICRRKNENDNE